MKDFLPLLRCASCRSDLSRREKDLLACRKCGREYPILHGVPCFTERRQAMTNKNHADSLTLAVKLLLKKSPTLFSWVHSWIAGPAVGLTPEKFAGMLDDGAVVLNLGSGTSRVGAGVVNVDAFAFANVDLVADIQRLPFGDGTIDAVISQSVLEHLPQPQAAVAEMARVLKPGGLVYVQTPFLHSFHSSPDDFHRWTAEGLELLFSAFTRTDSGIIYGPTAALVHISCEWLSLTLSCGSRRLHQLFDMSLQVLTGPLRLFDMVLARHADARNSSLIIYYVGKKKGPSPDRQRPPR
jgi:SAM-dependent methyltransferase